MNGVAVGSGVGAGEAEVFAPAVVELWAKAERPKVNMSAQDKIVGFMMSSKKGYDALELQSKAIESTKVIGFISSFRPR